MDDKGRTVNLTHEPILALGWPTMTMDLKVAEDVDLKGLTAGARVRFTLALGPDGIYRIQSIENAP